MTPFESPLRNLESRVALLQAQLDALRLIDDAGDHHEEIRRGQAHVARDLKRAIKFALPGPSVRKVEDEPSSVTPVETDPLSEQDIVRRQRELDDMIETFQRLLLRVS